MGGGDVIQQSIEQWPKIQAKYAKLSGGGSAGSSSSSSIGASKKLEVLNYDNRIGDSEVSAPTTTSVNTSIGGLTVADEPLRYDMTRMARMAAFGLVVVGPLCHTWYIALEALVPRADLVGAVSKMVIDQSIMAPISTVMFFGSMGLMEGKSTAATVGVIKDKTWSTLLVNWQIWPIAQVINMYFVPVTLRVLFLNVVGLGYNTILSRIANSS